METTKRGKSIRDINLQADDLLSRIFRKPKSPQNYGRYLLVEKLKNRYTNNAARALGYHGILTFTNIYSNSRPRTKVRRKCDSDYVQKVSREQYAAPFDWEHAKSCTTLAEMCDTNRALYKEGIDICKGCPFVGDPDRCAFGEVASIDTCMQRIRNAAPTL